MRLQVQTAFVSMLMMFWAGALAAEASRERIEAFMEVTGFDVALDALRASAGSAPAMLGLQEEDFGADWTRLADQVFDTAKMRSDALDILEQTLDDEMLGHAAEFYASDLGQRLVAAENASHMMEDALKNAEGARIVADLQSAGSPRLAYFEAMGAAIGSTDSAIRAVTEIQVRFILAAIDAGLLDSGMDEADLRGAIASQEDTMRQSMKESAMTGNAYTYRDFTDAEILAYQEALEHPLMGKVYALMSAVQFTLMAARFERLASEMTKLHPQQDI